MLVSGRMEVFASSVGMVNSEAVRVSSEMAKSLLALVVCPRVIIGGNHRFL